MPDAQPKPTGPTMETEAAHARLCDQEEGAQPKPTAAEVREQVARTLWIGEQETDETRDAAARYWDDADLTDSVIPRPYYRAQADMLAAAGLLVTAEHDAQVAEQALRDASDVIHREWLRQSSEAFRARADRIAAGETP